MANPNDEIKPRGRDQTVCDELDEKGKPCWGHLKRYFLAPESLESLVPSGHVLFRCQRCGRLYEGEPIRHLR